MIDSHHKAEENEPAWFCVRTKPKRESLAAKSLAQLDGVKTFCPRLRYKKATRRGPVWWIEAMFPGYIFAYFSRVEQERAVIHTLGVMTILKFGTHVPTISPEFIHSLKESMNLQGDDDEDLLTLQPILKPGDEVEIAHGAMQGIKGEVVEIAPANERVKILVEFLGNSQVIDTDLFSLLMPEKPLPES